MEKILSDIGIKYKVVQVTNLIYALVPIGKIEGYCVGDKFYNNSIHSIVSDISCLDEEIVVDSIQSIESLKETYNYNDVEFIGDFYLLEEMEYILTVEIKDDKLIKRKINLKQFIQKDNTEIYERQKNEPVITLNCDALEDIVNTSSILEIKEKLERYRKNINKYIERSSRDGVSSITVKNGHVATVDLYKKVETQQNVINLTNVTKSCDTGISVVGLEKYLKERVFGHDDELRRIATKLIMNYKSKPEYGTESILIVGPTGTGKTETIRAASDYLGLPFVQVNTANLVPQGIKGPSLEDYLYALIIASSYDMDKAQKGFIFLDEFDKIGNNSLDIKESVKQIFLKFIEGDVFLIDKETGDYAFNTRMLNKVFAGAFQDLFEKKKTPVGFNTNKQDSFVFTPSKITEGNYYGKELVTRIHHIFAYDPLSRENQKKVMLESKLSLLLSKKRRYQEQFGVELVILDEYIEAVLDKLSKEDKSMRDLNNIILSSLSEAEYQILANEGKVKQLILSPEIVSNPKDIIIK